MKRVYDNTDEHRCYLGTASLPHDILMLICAHLTPLEVQSLCRALCVIWQFDAASTIRRYKALRACPERVTEKYTEHPSRLMRDFITRPGMSCDDLFIEFLCSPPCYYCASVLASENIPLIEKYGGTESQLPLCSACAADLRKNRMTGKKMNVVVGQWLGPIYRMDVPYCKQVSRIITRMRSVIGCIDESVLHALLLDANYHDTSESFVRHHCIRQLAEPPGKDTLYLLSDVKTALTSRLSAVSKKLFVPTDTAVQTLLPPHLST